EIGALAGDVLQGQAHLAQGVLGKHGRQETIEGLFRAAVGVVHVTGKVLNIRNEVLRQSLTTFQGVEHRLEKVLKVKNVLYINDSKGTNVNSTWYALESMTTPVIWIVGGKDKGNDYRPLFDLVRDKVRAIICLGADNRKLHEVFEGMVDSMYDTSSAEEAVKVAYSIAKPGETVLLSPACASFDLFKNYEERGRLFKEAVKNL
ncbi:MAG: cyanophycin synthetase, partial [Eubacteriales bacterium]|nr:cyanophycin synthetase [Eubacteriales bacterium]